MESMKLRSYLTERLQRLPPPVTRDLSIERDLKVPMRDGAVLLADRWVPRSGGDGLPTALIRIPYGRRGLVAAQTARPLAERGFQVLVQSTRGTFGSGGAFDPLRRERDDGLDTLDWVIKQGWFGESMILVGSSYLGVVQWAVARAPRPCSRTVIRYGRGGVARFLRLAAARLSGATPARHWAGGESGGAFPRYDRNLGTGEPRATATAMQVAQQQVFHDAQHPSAVILPVRRDPTTTQREPNA
jgi:predicted acyl esterase